MGFDRFEERTSDASNQSNLAHSLILSVQKTTAPYFLRHFGEMPKAEIILGKAGVDFAFMSANRYMGSNFLIINYKQWRNCFAYKNNDDKIYLSAFICNAVIHENIHFLEPVKVFEKNAKYDIWAEGVAFVLSWLVLSDFYRDAGIETDFWQAEEKLFDKVNDAIRQKKLRIGLERVVAISNYEMRLAIINERIAYEPPGFLPREMLCLFYEIVKNDKPLFMNTSNGTIERIRNKDKDCLPYFIKCAKGIMVINYLLAKKSVPVRELIANPIDDKDMDKIFSEVIRS